MTFGNLKMFKIVVFESSELLTILGSAAPLSGTDNLDLKFKYHIIGFLSIPH